MQDTKSLWFDCICIINNVLYYLDQQAYAELAMCFIEDGVFHRQGRSLMGRAEIVAALAQRPRQQRTRHLVSNTVILSGDDGRPRTQSYMTVYRHDEGGDHDRALPVAGPVRLSRVLATFVAGSEGLKIAEMRLITDFEIGAGDPARAAG